MTSILIVMGLVLFFIFIYKRAGRGSRSWDSGGDSGPSFWSGSDSSSNSDCGSSDSGGDCGGGDGGGGGD